METVKVDLQKLQILNDRIAQTIDALNQVRLSTHGLQHSGSWSTQQGVSGFSPIGQQGFSPVAQQAGYGVNPFSGISHTSPFVNPFVQSQLPWSPVGFPQQTMVGQPWTAGIGISHSGLQVDPQMSMRLAQTFPFVGYPYPPMTY
jgi:hypothetical protein